MSLLLDALKKAEQEKKASARRLEQVGEGSRAEETPAELTVSEDEATGGASADQQSVTGEHALTDTQEMPVPDQEFTETVEFSLEPLTTTTPEQPEAGGVPGAGQMPAEAIKSTEPAGDVKSEDITQENIVAGLVEEKTPSTSLSDTTIIEGLSIDETPSAPFDDTFHGLVMDELEGDDVSYDETLPGVPAAELLKDIGGGQYQPTPVAAQTVFTAGTGSHSRASSFKWMILGVLCVLAVLSFGVFYYYTITPVARELPSPIVARGIESIDIPVSVAQKIQESSVVSGTLIAGPDSTESAITGTAEEEEVQPEPSIDTEITIPAYQQDTHVVMVFEELPEIKEQKTFVEEPEPEVKDLVAEETAIAKEPDTLPAYIPIDAKLITISKNREPEPVSLQLRAAFDAYQAGNYAQAGNLYRAILDNSSSNRDALLGMAAIAMRERNLEDAYRYYSKLLTLDPADNVAMSAMINLFGNNNLQESESTVKSLLSRESESPYLYFTLGNIYASQLRWPEAQQAFFDAHRLDSSNPNYALNLAISLDHVGQYKTALDYYDVAIKLADENDSHFDTASVQARIQAISDNMASTL